MILVDVVRCVGVTLALGGAVWVAPYAFGRLLRVTWGQLRRAAALILRRRRDVSLGAAAAHGSAYGVATLTGSASGRAWFPDAPVGEQIERLHDWVDDVFRKVGELRAHADQRIDTLAAQTSADVETLRGEHAALAARVDADKREDERLNTDGFPLIALGIIMGGLPDAWLMPPVSGVLLALAAIVAARAARLWLTARHSTPHP